MSADARQTLWQKIFYFQYTAYFILVILCLAPGMRGVFVDFVALLTRNAVVKRCVFADVYT